MERSCSDGTKNHPGGLDDDDYETKPRIYATGKSDCSVAALRNTYLKDALKPKKSTIKKLLNAIIYGTHQDQWEKKFSMI